MIYRECDIQIDGDVAMLGSDIILYRNDRNIDLRFKVVKKKFNYSTKYGDNIILQADPSYSQFKLIPPNDRPPITFPVQDVIDGYAYLNIGRELIDEVEECGDYDFQIRFMDDDGTSVLTIPPVIGQIHIKESYFTDDDVLNPEEFAVSGIITSDNSVIVLSDGSMIALQDNKGVTYNG